MIDEIDIKIIRELQINSKRTTHQLAKAINIPRTTIHNRIKKLENAGIIVKYKAVVDHTKIGKNIKAIIHIVVSSDQKVSEIVERLKKCAVVQEAYLVAGQFDIIAKIIIRDTKELSMLMYDSEQGIRNWKGVERSESMIVLETIKEDGVIEAE